MCSSILHGHLLSRHQFDLASLEQNLKYAVVSFSAPAQQSVGDFWLEVDCQGTECCDNSLLIHVDSDNIKNCCLSYMVWSFWFLAAGAFSLTADELTQVELQARQQWDAPGHPGWSLDPACTPVNMPAPTFDIIAAQGAVAGSGFLQVTCSLVSSPLSYPVRCHIQSICLPRPDSGFSPMLPSPNTPPVNISEYFSPRFPFARIALFPLAPLSLPQLHTCTDVYRKPTRHACNVHLTQDM